MTPSNKAVNRKKKRRTYKKEHWRLSARQSILLRKPLKNIWLSAKCQRNDTQSPGEGPTTESEHPSDSSHRSQMHIFSFLTHKNNRRDRRYQRSAADEGGSPASTRYSEESRRPDDRPPTGFGMNHDLGRIFICWKFEDAFELDVLSTCQRLFYGQ